MSKLKLKQNQENPNCKYLYTFARSWAITNKIEVHSLDIERSTEFKAFINLPRCTEFKRFEPSITSLPNNEFILLDCQCSIVKDFESFIYVVDSLTMKIKKEVIYPKKYHLGVASTYLNGSVYILCRPNNIFKIMLLKYDVSKNKLKPLANIQFENILFQCNFYGFEDKILIATNASKNIYIHDLYSNSYSEISVVPYFNDKILLSFKGRAYYIEFSGCIYESGYNNPYIWSEIGNFYLWRESGWFYNHFQKNDTTNVSWAYYNGSIFLRKCTKIDEGDRPENYYIEFNLEKENIHAIEIR